jgi:DNA polymerase III, beta subunit
MLSFTADASLFQDVLNRANKLISKAKKSLFISPGVLLRVRDRNLTVFATDIDSWIIQDMPIYEGEEGEVFIPIAETLKLVKGFKRVSAIKVMETEDSIKISAEGATSEYEIRKYNLEEFPQTPDYTLYDGYTIDLERFVEGLDIVSWCSAENDSRVFLNGVYFHSGDGYLNLVASDGTVLGKVSKMRFEGEIKGIIPINLVDVVRILDEGSAVIKVEDGYLYLATSVEGANISLIIRLINEEYANYESLIPFEFIAGATLNREDLEDAVERIFNFLPETGEIDIEILDGEFILSTLSSKGRGLEKVGGDTFGKIKTKMFGNHLREIVKKLDYERLDIKFSGSNTPIYISPSGSDEVIFLTVPLT